MTAATITYHIDRANIIGVEVLEAAVAAFNKAQENLNAANKALRDEAFRVTLISCRETEAESPSELAVAARVSFNLWHNLWNEAWLAKEAAGGVADEKLEARVRASKIQSNLDGERLSAFVDAKAQSKCAELRLAVEAVEASVEVARAAVREALAPLATFVSVENL